MEVDIKQTFVYITLFGLLFSIINAQENVGIKLGGGFSNYYGSDATKCKLSPCFSIFIWYPYLFTSDHFGVYSEFGYSQRGAKIDVVETSTTYVIVWPYPHSIPTTTYTNVSTSYKTRNIDFIVYGKYCFNNVEKSTPFVSLGFYYSFGINDEGPEGIAPTETSGNSLPPSGLDYGLLISAGYDFGARNYGVRERLFGLELRYLLGLHSLYNEINLKNNSLTLLLRIYLF